MESLPAVVPNSNSVGNDLVSMSGKEKLIKTIPTGRTLLGEEISYDSQAQPGMRKLAKELAGAVRLRKCLSDLLEPATETFSLYGEEVVVFSNTQNEDIDAIIFDYEVVRTEKQLAALIAVSADTEWTTDTWLKSAFADDTQIILSVKKRGAKRPQGFVCYRRNTVVDWYGGEELTFAYTLTIEYAYVTKRMRGKGLGSALIAPIVMDCERDVAYLAKRLNADRFKSMPVRPCVSISADAYSLGGAHLADQVYAIIAESGCEHFEQVPHNRFEAHNIFENDVCI